MFRPLAPLTLAAVLAAAPLSAFDLTAMTDEERSAFRDEIREYLIENPEVIVEAMRVLEDRRALAQTQNDRETIAANFDAIVNDGFSWVGGNPDGDVTLVEFMDYRCGFCRRAHPEVAKLLQADGNIRWVVKEFPILGEDSVVASRFAVATKQIMGDDAYKQAHDALIEMSGAVSDVTLRRLSDGLGFDTDEILDHMDSEDVTREIQATRELAQRLKISGTPTFILQDEMLRGFLPADEMAEIVAEKRG
ncbi:MAG: DsbA family protein [Pseudomonadota bacterium]